MYKILYTNYDGEICSLSPVDTEEDAITEARKAQIRQEFDIEDQHVYLICGINMSMRELTLSDLTD